MRISLFHLPSFFPELHTSDEQFLPGHAHRDRPGRGFRLSLCLVCGTPFLSLRRPSALRSRDWRRGGPTHEETSALAPGLLSCRSRTRFGWRRNMPCSTACRGGRLEFGIGRGFQKGEYDAFERDMGDSRALFEEAPRHHHESLDGKTGFSRRPIPQGAESPGHSAPPFRIPRPSMLPVFLRRNRSSGPARWAII